MWESRGLIRFIYEVCTVQEDSPTLDPSTLAFRPLEYWKPPKAVRHIRARSSAIFSTGPAGPERHTFVNQEEGDKGSMSFARLDEGLGRGKNGLRSDVQMMDGFGTPRGPPPAYKVDREDTLARPWWDVRAWGWKRFAIAGAAVAVVIIILVVVIVEVTKKSKYPDYSKLNYKIVDTCKMALFQCFVL